MMEIKGVPPDYIVELSSRRNLFFEKDSIQPIIVTNSRGRRRLPNTKTLPNVLKKCQDEKFLDFIDLCLDWDPVNRMTPLEALQHEWILEGLPEKVLVHHQRMFGGKDDKMNLIEKENDEEDDEEEQVKMSEALNFLLPFWILVVSCVVVYGCVLPFNNIA